MKKKIKKFDKEIKKSKNKIMKNKEEIENFYLRIQWWKLNKENELNEKIICKTKKN